MMETDFDASYRELCDQLWLEPLGVQEWIEKLRVDGVMNVSFELWDRESGMRIVQAWNLKWLGRAAGTGKAATDVEAAPRCCAGRLHPMETG